MSYRIVNLSPFGYETLAHFDSYSEAEAEYDSFAESLPHAWVEIISEAEFLAGSPTD